MAIIRKGNQADIPSIISIAYKVWPAAYAHILSADQLDYMLDKFYSIQSLTDQMNHQKHLFIIAENNQRVPFGFASYAPHKDNNKIFHLHKIYVLPHQQKSNTGTQLIQYIINDITVQNATSLQLNVNRMNNAIHFYKKIGFNIIREEDIDIGHGYFMNDYVMEMQL